MNLPDLCPICGGGMDWPYVTSYSCQCEAIWSEADFITPRPATGGREVSDLTKRLLQEANSVLGKPLCDGGQLFREAAKRIAELEAGLRECRHAVDYTGADEHIKWLVNNLLKEQKK